MESLNLFPFKRGGEDKEETTVKGYILMRRCARLNASLVTDDEFAAYLFFFGESDAKINSQRHIRAARKLDLSEETAAAYRSRLQGMAESCRGGADGCDAGEYVTLASRSTPKMSLLEHSHLTRRLSRLSKYDEMTRGLCSADVVNHARQRQLFDLVLDQVGEELYSIEMSGSTRRDSQTQKYIRLAASHRRAGKAGVAAYFTRLALFDYRYINAIIGLRELLEMKREAVDFSHVLMDADRIKRSVELFTRDAFAKLVLLSIAKKNAGGNKLRESLEFYELLLFPFMFTLLTNEPFQLRYYELFDRSRIDAFSKSRKDINSFQFTRVGEGLGSDLCEFFIACETMEAESAYERARQLIERKEVDLRAFASIKARGDSSFFSLRQNEAPPSQGADRAEKLKLEMYAAVYNMTRRSMLRLSFPRSEEQVARSLSEEDAFDQIRCEQQRVAGMTGARKLKFYVQKSNPEFRISKGVEMKLLCKHLNEMATTCNSFHEMVETARSYVNESQELQKRSDIEIDISCISEPDNVRRAMESL